MRFRSVVWYLLIFASVVAAMTPEVLHAQNQISFNRDVLPILSDRCFLCHGPDEATREAELRFDIEGAVSEDVIAPGNPE